MNRGSQGCERSLWAGFGLLAPSALHGLCSATLIHFSVGGISQAKHSWDGTAFTVSSHKPIFVAVEVYLHVIGDPMDNIQSNTTELKQDLMHLWDRSCLSMERTAVSRRAPHQSLGDDAAIFTRLHYRRQGIVNANTYKLESKGPAHNTTSYHGRDSCPVRPG